MDWWKKKKWKLIYRATTDGFDTSNFHSKCDNQGPTIVIIKSNQGNIFGGFNKNAWISNNAYTTSSENFLFSYKNQDSKIKKPIQLKCHGTSTAAYGGSGYHITFGGGHDLYLCSGCNSINSSYSNLGHSYTPPYGYTYNNQNAKDFLAGAYNFTVAEIEVFKQ